MYVVKSVVCDYGIYDEDNRLLLIINSYHNAKLICDILNFDKKHDGQHLPSMAIPRESLLEIYDSVYGSTD